MLQVDSNTWIQFCNMNFEVNFGELVKTKDFFSQA